MVYEDVFPGADLEYVVLPDMIKENIIVNQAQSTYTYLFDLSYDGLVPVPQGDGSICFFKDVSDNAPVFFLESPYMYDAAGEESYALAMTLNGNTLTLTADGEWVNDEAREFPVVIDPTVHFGTSAFSDLYVINGVYAGSPRKNAEIRAGRNLTNITRSYIKMTLPTIPTGSVVTSASLKLYQDYYYSAPLAGNISLRVYDCYNVAAWSENSVSWNKQPFSNSNNGYTSSGATLLDTKTASSSASSYTFNITGAVKTWIETGTNKGLMIAAYSEANKTQVDFHSSRASNAANRPEMWFVYSAPSVNTTGVWNTGAAAATSSAIAVTCSSSWTVTDDQSWLSISKSSSSFTISVTKNTNVIERTGTVIVKMSNGTILTAISVKQLGAEGLALNTTSWKMSDQKETSSAITLTTNSNANWTITSSDSSWLTTTPSSGKGSSTFKINVTKNTGNSERTGTITVQTGTFAETINVVQLDYISSLFQEPATEYNHRLGTEAMYLSYAAYNDLPNNTLLNIPDDFMAGMEDSVSDVLTAYGFNAIEEYHYDYSNMNLNTAGHTIAHREVLGPDGKYQNVVIVAVRGTAPWFEWLTDIASMFNCSEWGFQKAGTDTLKSLVDGRAANEGYYSKGYMERHNLGDESIFLVTGHSLGGAVANLVAAEISERLQKPKQVYCYTFGTPNVGKNLPETYINTGTNVPETYTNIFNILNRSDVMTLFPGWLTPNDISRWGRYGIDINIGMLESQPTGLKDMVADNHKMPTYYNWMKSYEDLTYTEIQEISSYDVDKGWLPKLLTFKCPVGVTLHDADGNDVAHESTGGDPEFDLQSSLSGSISWITEDGAKVFFVPYGYNIADASVIANDTGTMTYSIADMNGNQPCDMKTFENVGLTLGKEFSTIISEDSEYIPIPDIQLFITANGVPIGEVSEDGSETIY